ncbi:MAG: glycosyltransferase family 4 protein [Pseudomonadota bacterium]
MKFHWVFSTFAVGGPQRRFANLAPYLGDNIEHIVTAMDGDYAAAALLGDTIDWRPLHLPVTKTSGTSLANINTFRKVLIEESADLLLTSNWGTIEWRLANRGRVARPQVHFEDGFGPIETIRKRKISRDLTRRVLFANWRQKSKTTFIAPSKDLGDLFQSAWGAPVDRVRVIPNGVPFHHFSSIAPWPNRPFTVGFVGALRREKRIDRLIRIFASVRRQNDARLLIVGDGPLRAVLEREASASPAADAIQFAGAQDDVAPYLGKMDLFCLPSDTEQMPISLIEAMAAGLPVVASDVGDVKSTVARENRKFIHAAEDEAAMTCSIRGLAADRALRSKIGAANRDRASARYSLEAMLDAHKAAYFETMGQKPAESRA